MKFEELRFEGQINASAQGYVQDVGRLHLLLQEALECYHGSMYQPPRYDHMPTKEEEDSERRQIEECEDNARRLQQIAANIFLALTGKKVYVSREGRFEARLKQHPWSDELQNRYEAALDEIQASIVLAGGSKPSHPDLEHTPLGRFLASAIRNGIRMRTLYIPKPEEMR